MITWQTITWCHSKLHPRYLTWTPNKSTLIRTTFIRTCWWTHLNTWWIHPKTPYHQDTHYHLVIHYHQMEAWFQMVKWCHQIKVWFQMVRIWGHRVKTWCLQANKTWCHRDNITYHPVTRSPHREECPSPGMRWITLTSTNHLQTTLIERFVPEFLTVFKSINDSTKTSVGRL